MLIYTMLSSNHGRSTELQSKEKLRAVLSPTSLKTPWGDAVGLPIKVIRESWRRPFRELKEIGTILTGSTYFKG